MPLSSPTIFPWPGQEVSAEQKKATHLTVQYLFSETSKFMLFCLFPSPQSYFLELFKKQNLQLNSVESREGCTIENHKWGQREAP